MDPTGTLNASLMIEIGNISLLRFQLDRISGLHVKVVHSSTLVLDKAPICIDDTLSPAQNREYTPPEMGLSLMSSEMKERSWVKHMEAHFML